MPWIGQLPAQSSTQPQAGYAPSYGPFLPRPPDTFTAGAFGPFSPILPVPVDQPAPGSQRPQPRRWQYRPGYNLPVGEPGNDGYKLASFATLKQLADSYSILRTCLEIRKNEIRALDWDITLTPDAAKAYRGDREAMRDFGERQAKAKKWFSKPDPNYFTFSSWLHASLDQVFMYDALSLYLCPTRAKRRGTGLLGSGLDSLWLVDGAGIRPLVGLHGETPQPPAVAFEQYLYGVPRSDYTTMIDGRDLIDGGFTAEDLKGEFRGDQLLYLPYLPRTDSPYGFGLVEQAIIPIMTGLRKQAFQLSYFDESTIPSVYISPGDVNMTANQIRELQDALNAIAGDINWRYKVIVLPPGSKTMPQKDVQIVDQSDEWIATEVCMVANINPMEVGILPRVSTVASPFAAREMAQAQRSIHARTSTKPTLKFVTEIMNTILQVVCQQADMRFLFSGMEEEQDLAAMTDMKVKQVQSAISSIDEARDALGVGPPWGTDETSGPVVFTAAGPLPLGQGGTDSASDQMAAEGGRTATLTDAHAASEGASNASNASGGGSPPAGASGVGRMNGPVTQRQRRRGGALAPAHATAEGAPGASGGPSAKAASAELEALARHLRKGMPVTQWEPRNLPGLALAVISEDLAKGLSVDQSVDIARTLVLGKADREGRHDHDRSRRDRREDHREHPAPPAAPQQAAAQQAAVRQARMTALARQYAPQITKALSGLSKAILKLVRAWMAGTLAVTAAVLAGMIRDLVAKALRKVLPGLWRDGWALGSGGQPHDGDLDWQAQIAQWDIGTVAAISDTKISDIMTLITQGVRERLTSRDLAARIRALLDFTGRADMIARTETARAVMAAVLRGFRDTGVTYVTWHVHSMHPCAKCLKAQASPPLPLGTPFPGTNLAAPPAHPRCVIGSTRITAPLAVMPADVAYGLPFDYPALRPVLVGDGREASAAAVAVAERDFGRGNIRAVTDREYVGDVVTIRTALGHELTATPNHPVATRRGWVPIAELAVGDHVLSSTGSEWGAASVDPDVDDIPPRIEDVSQSFPVQFGAVPTAAEDFHGDGAGSEVCVIRADGLLVDDRKAGVAEHVREHVLGGGDIPVTGTLALNAEGFGGKELGSLGFAPDGGMGGLRVPLASLGGHAPQPDPLRFAETPQWDLSLEEAAADRRAADSEGFCERLLAVASDVTLDEVIQVKRDVVTTHVYNLETVEGWYVANGILTHNCMCSLTPAAPPKTPVTAKALRRRVGLNGEAFLAAFAEDGDGNAAGGGASSGTRHLADGTPVPGGSAGVSPGGEPPRWNGSEPFPGDRWVDGGHDDEQGGERDSGTPATVWPAPNYMDGYWPQGGHGTQQSPASSPGSATGRPPNSVGKAADAAARFLKDAPPVKASMVYKLMSENFAPDALKWVKGARWAGPAEVPLSLIDFSSADKWAAHRQKAKVDDFARQLKAGGKVNPVILTVKPGHNHARCVDGHHRVMACKKLGIPVRAYVAFLDKAGSSPADRTYLQQFRSGSDPGNKSFTAGATGSPGAVSGLVPFDLRGQQALPVAAGLAVRAADTGRVLMLQRAVTDDDPAAGKWEMPGGCLEHGETPLQAALREWSEETGHPVPRGSLMGRWDSADGRYQGFVVTVPHEGAVDISDGRDQVINPDDPDGDCFEAVAWWDPADLAGSPAIRPQLHESLPAVMQALTAAEAEKAQRGNAETLREYWTHEAHPGPSHFSFEEPIKWGEPGDWYRCTSQVEPYLGAEGSKGYCNLEHHRALGYWPAQHARMEREGKE